MSEACARLRTRLWNPLSMNPHEHRCSENATERTGMGRGSVSIYALLALDAMCPCTFNDFRAEYLGMVAHDRARLERWVGGCECRLKGRFGLSWDHQETAAESEGMVTYIYAVNATRRALSTRQYWGFRLGGERN